MAEMLGRLGSFEIAEWISEFSLRDAAEREAIEKIRADLPSRVASASVNASKYTEELGKFEGRARELVDAVHWLKFAGEIAVACGVDGLEAGAFLQQDNGAEASQILGHRR